MKIGLIFAMKEEAAFLDNLFNSSGKIIDHPFFKINEFSKNNIKYISIISKIGKAFSASATTLLIDKLSVDAIINIGSCGGINCNIGDIILSNKALYHDVNVTAFGYEKGALPNEPLIFNSNQKLFEFNKILKNFENEIHINNGIIATGDQFINDISLVKEISKINNNIKALEMEAAAIAQVCYHYNIDFLFIKKVSDLADKVANVSFNQEIIKFEDKIIKIINNLTDILGIS